MELLLELQPVHMSGDETDPEVSGPPKGWLIINPHWRSAEFTQFFTRLDEIHHENWRYPSLKPSRRKRNAGQNKPPGYKERTHHTQGAPPRTRKRSAKHEDGHAPPFLYRNCYDAEWMETLPRWRKEAMQIVDRDYDFTIHPDDLPK